MAMTKEEKNEYSRNYKKSKKGVVTAMYHGQKSSSKKRGHDLPTYSKEEIKEWLYSQTLFHVLYDNWKRLDFQKMYKPSVDRIDDKLGYTMANIQLMTWGENDTKQRSIAVGNNHYSANPRSFYETSDVTRFHFKTICKNRDWSFSNFSEVESGSRSSTHKKYYYVIKDEFIC